MKTKESIKSLDLSVLNEDQKKAFFSLVNYIKERGNDDIYVLKGWAGTGKTFCISVLVRYLLDELYRDKKYFKISVTGPTNKSVRVIKKASGLRNNRVNFMTIHKLLGLKERITKDGLQEFVNDHGSSTAGIKQTKLLIIDEVSMLNDDLFQQIIRFRDRMKIICMGDPAQIPPVGRPDCIPFLPDMADIYGIKTLELREVMRQKGDNPIIDCSINIRENLNSTVSKIPLKTSIIKSGDGIEVLNLSDPKVRSGFSSIVERYYKTEEFRRDPEYVKIIAWRNKTVSVMNSIVRRSLYGDDAQNSKILVGERLIANNPIIFEGMILFNTNDEFTVTSYVLKEDSVKFDFGEFTLKYYETNIKYISDDGSEKKDVIDILHEDSEDEFTRISNSLKMIAIRKKGKDKSWIDYYNFLRTYADVSYAYAITAHKSQGSTYTVAIVSEDDIDLNYNVIERNRIKYTAYTRASKKLYILKRA